MKHHNVQLAAPDRLLVSLQPEHTQRVRKSWCSGQESVFAFFLLYRLFIGSPSSAPCRGTGRIRSALRPLVRTQRLLQWTTGTCLCSEQRRLTSTSTPQCRRCKSLNLSEAFAAVCVFFFYFFFVFFLFFCVFWGRGGGGCVGASPELNAPLKRAHRRPLHVRAHVRQRQRHSHHHTHLHSLTPSFITHARTLAMTLTPHCLALSLSRKKKKKKKKKKSFRSLHTFFLSHWGSASD